MQPGFRNEEDFQVIRYLFGVTANATGGASYDDPLPFVDGDLMTIPAQTLITNVYVIIDVAITGTTDLDVGDDDNADGWVDGSLSITLATPGMYGWDAKLGGAYKRVETAGATDAADIFVVPAAKYYGAAGKEIKLDVTTANTAGKMRVVIEGCMFKLIA